MEHWKAAGLDLTPILHVPELPEGAARHNTTARTTASTRRSTTSSSSWPRPALESGEPVRAQLEIRNVNRTVGTILGHEVTKRYKGEGLPDGTIDLTFTGSAGQSFGAFVPRGHHAAARGRRQRLRRQGPLGRPHRRPAGPRRDRSTPPSQIIAGNVIGYGATSGEIFLRGQVGERFCVRNSGATRGRRGRGRPRLRVHDRRPRRHPRPDRAQLRGRHVRGRGLRARPRRAAGQPGAGRARARSTATPPTSCTAWCAGTSRRPGRTVAEELLADWPAAVRRFTEVMPSDFKRVLEAKAEAARGGPAEDETATKMMEALHG